MTEKQETKMIKDLSIGKLKPFTGHPYRVVDDDEMDRLVESIEEHGVMTPIYVRPIDGGYEVISGHRRIHAAKRAGLDTVPAIEMEMTRDEAAIALVDSNLHRERLLPSEKAFAYKLKLEALSRQGKRDLTCGQVGHKSRDDIDGDESGRQIQRYIRLTHLIPEILNRVDEGQIGMRPAVEISYLKPEEQQMLLETIDSEQATPSLSQAQRMKKLSQEGKLTDDAMLKIMMEQKKPDCWDVTLKGATLRKYFPRSYTPQQIRQAILNMLERAYQKRQQENAQTR